jgi:hypothetical protein
VRTVIASGGGGGLLNINWGSHGAAENTLIKVVKLIVGRGLEHNSGSDDAYDEIYSEPDDSYQDIHSESGDSVENTDD